MTRYIITDEIGTDGTVTVNDCGEIADAIRPWYVDAPAEVLRAVDELQGAICRGEPSDGIETYLGVRVEVAH